MSFITYNSTSKEVTIDGYLQNKTKKTYIDDELVVQLKTASQKESNFNWNGHKIVKVIAKNVLIYDVLDLDCLKMFIQSEIKIDFSASYLSPDALENFNKLMSELVNKNLKVVNGSCIKLPWISSSYGGGEDLTLEAKRLCKAIGFNEPEFAISNLEVISTTKSTSEILNSKQEQV